VDLRTGQTIALLEFQSGVQEVFAVALLPRRFPDLINDDANLLENSFVVPTACLGEVAATVRSKEGRRWKHEGLNLSHDELSDRCILHPSEEFALTMRSANLFPAGRQAGPVNVVGEVKPAGAELV
jgi:hypothetical protein